MSQLPGTRRGFTLLELLVAIVLLTVGILALARTMAGLGTQSTRARMRADLAEVIDGKFEELRLVGAVSQANPAPLGIGGSTGSCVANHCDTVLDGRGLQHQRRWSVAAGPVGSTFVVTVQASPLGAAFAGQTAQRSTLVVLIR